MAQNWFMKHRAIVDGEPVGGWGTWHEAFVELAARQLVGSVYGIIVFAPNATIEGEGFYA